MTTNASPTKEGDNGSKKEEGHKAEEGSKEGQEENHQEEVETVRLSREM